MHRKAQGVAARVSQKHVHPHVVSPSINLFLSFECLYLLFILFISLSWSSSSMWSEPPSTKITAHPQNEEYCPVAIHNTLTPGRHTFALVGSGARVFVAEVQACTDGLQVVSMESAVSANDSFASSTCNFNISTLDHMKKLRYNAFVRNIEHFGTRSTSLARGLGRHERRQHRASSGSIRLSRWSVYLFSKELSEKVARSYLLPLGAELTVQQTQ